ncbi:MAG: TolB-related protein [Actinomycetia bacterium]|nr:TolB-related protein [Actinomycetes bacterium]
MLVKSDGTKIDLSNSFASDSAPSLSPDGKFVAFSSTRGGQVAEYVVATGGGAARQVTPPFAVSPFVVWSPDSANLVVLDGAADRPGGIHLASRDGGVWRLLDRGDQPSSLVGWSPDGSRLAYVTSLGAVKVVTPSGRRLFDVVGENATWSPSGRLAVARDSQTWWVYDVHGRRISAFPATSVAWSADDRLASITQTGQLQVRVHGRGRPVVSVRVRHAAYPRWLDDQRLRVQGPNGWVGYDLARHRTFPLPPAYGTWSSAITPSGQQAFGESSYGTLVFSTLSGATHTVTSVPYCQGKNRDAFGYLQVLPDGSGAVYASSCAAPRDLFAVSPSGDGLTRLTSMPTDEVSPAVSPDGTQVAFSRVGSADCEGCNSTIWMMSADGSNARAFPAGRAKNGGILQNDNPSFSPDGSAIVFDRWNSGASDQSSLFEVPTTNGTPHSLGLTGNRPTWGPIRIAFDAAGTIKTAAPDGSDVKLAPGVPKSHDGVPAWSRDGRLALLEYSQPSLSILIPSTARRISLPGFHFAAGVPSGITWSPDGTQFAFVAADAEGVSDLWTIHTDGTELTRITHGIGAAGTPSWR